MSSTYGFANMKYTKETFENSYGDHSVVRRRKESDPKFQNRREFSHDVTSRSSKVIQSYIINKEIPDQRYDNRYFEFLSYSTKNSA